MIKDHIKADALKHENKMHELKTIIIHSELAASECLRSMVHDPNFFEEITDEDIAELLHWSGDDEYITVEDIRREDNVVMDNLITTVELIRCPVCGKTLTRLEGASTNAEGVSTFYCDECDLDIIVSDGKLKDIENFKKEVDLDHGKSLLGMACSEIEFDGKTKKEVSVNFGCGNDVDEVSFDVSSFEELYECWIDFCEENDIDPYTVSINFVDEDILCVEDEEESSDTCFCDRCKSCSDKECNGATPKTKCEKTKDSFANEFVINYLKETAHNLAKDIRRQREKMNDLQKTIIEYGGDVFVGRVLIDDPKEIKEFLNFLDRI